MNEYGFYEQLLWFHVQSLETIIMKETGCGTGIVDIRYLYLELEHI